MALIRFSRRAEADLLRIASYTRRIRGENQTLRYLEDLEECCYMLANNPASGRLCEYIRPGLRRMEHGRHVIFYRNSSRGILILRILHQGMLPDP